MTIKFPLYKIFALFIVLLFTFKVYIEAGLNVAIPRWLWIALSMIMIAWGTYEKYREGKLKQWLWFVLGLAALIGLIAFLQRYVFS